MRPSLAHSLTNRVGDPDTTPIEIAVVAGDIDLELCTIRVDRQLIEQLGGGSAFGPPKSVAGRRAVPFSDIIRADLREHLERFVSGDDEALVFTSPMGTPMRHSNFYRRVWLPAVAKVPPRVFIFMTCGIPGTPRLLTRVRTCAN